MRCLSWVAVSSKPQTEKESPAKQREQNQRTIDALGGTTVAVLDVPGESREIISFEEACQRIDAYAQLRRHIDAKDADLIVCRDLSRLGRTTALVTQVVSYCHRAGIAIYSRAAPPTSLDAAEQARNEGATLMLALEGALSQVEMIKLRQRHADGMVGRVMAGKFYSRIPYGYTRVYDADGTESYAIDEAQAEVVRLIFSLYLDRGLGMKAIANELNRLGYEAPSGDGWSYSGMSSIFNRVPRYAGWTEANRSSKSGRSYLKARGDWPPIITQATADAITTERASRANSRRAASVYKYRFAKAIYCAHCENRMWATAQPSNWTDNILRSYYCGNRKCKHRNGIAESRVFDAVQADIASLTVDELPPLPTPATSIPQRIEQAEAELSALAAERARLLSAYTRLQAITEDDLSEGMAEIGKRQDAIEQRILALADAAEKEADQSARMERFQSVVNVGLAMLNNDDIRAVNAWIRRHLRIYIYDKNVERIEYI